MDSFETTPKKIPSKIIQIKISKNDIIKIKKLADDTQKKGIKGNTPPKNGDPPLTHETTMVAKVSAFS